MEYNLLLLGAREKHTVNILAIMGLHIVLLTIKSLVQNDRGLIIPSKQNVTTLEQAAAFARRLGHTLFKVFC